MKNLLLKAENGKSASITVKKGENITFGGTNGKKFSFRNIDGENYNISNASKRVFKQRINARNNYLMDDYGTARIVCDWRIKKADEHAMIVYTNEGYHHL
ncbi:MAG: hypothetical protein WAV31_03405 [Candidatus Moraniibacteriota bacterium]